MAHKMHVKLPKALRDTSDYFPSPVAGRGCSMWPSLCCTQILQNIKALERNKLGTRH